MIEMNFQAVSFIVRQLDRTTERARRCVEHYDSVNTDLARSEALFALGEASGLRNLLRHMTRDLPAELASTMYYLDQVMFRLKHAGK